MCGRLSVDSSFEFRDGFLSQELGDEIRGIIIRRGRPHDVIFSPSRSVKEFK